MAEKGVLSARGVLVNFDLMKIKQQIAATPKAVTVKAREDFIDQKFKRRLKRQTQEAVSQVQQDPIEDTTSQNDIEEIEITIEKPVKGKQ